MCVLVAIPNLNGRGMPVLERCQETNNYVFAGKYNLKVESDGVVQRWIKESVSTPMLLYSL